jgi:hypothetical protein
VGDGTELGTLASNLSLPFPPPRVVTKIFEHRLENGSIRVEYLPTAQLKATLEVRKEEAELRTLSVTSCPVTNPNKSFCILGMSWSMPQEQIGIIIDGVLVAIRNSTSAIPDHYIVQPEAPSSEAIDYSKKNIEALAKRKGRLAGFQPVPNRQRGSKDYIFRKLGVEILQVQDLLEAVKRGKLHHSFGLAARLRLLIAQGTRPMPLLQMCAAAVDEPLIVYTTRKPFFIPIMQELQSSYGLSGDITAHPDGRLNNPIDLDVWLKTEAGNIMSEMFTHKQLLNAIGNTVASHVDQDLHPYVMLLESIQIQGSDRLVHYLLKVGATTLALSKELFEKK